MSSIRMEMSPRLQQTMKLAPRMAAIVRDLPGYRSHKAFTAPDGERLTYVEFEDEASLRAWAKHPEHIQAKRLGRSTFFSEYSFQICETLRGRVFDPDTSLIPHATEE